MPLSQCHGRVLPVLTQKIFVDFVVLLQVRIFFPQICNLSLIVGLTGNEKNIKGKKELCLLYASKDLSVLSPSKVGRKQLAFLCYPLPLKENPHAKGALQEKETENKEDFQRSPGSPARLLT